MPEYTLAPIGESDRRGVVDIFNHYVENTFAAYPEERVPDAFFDLFLGIARTHPAVAVRDAAGEVAGFGMLRPHNPMPAFARTAEITYFLRPDLTGRGIGADLLGYLEAEARKCGIACILASISSLNEGSIRFHRRHGFTECGRFQNVGAKRGVLFDVVWMQKEL
ncbi:N-acetyltransferase [Methanoculleus sp. Wushi-C6]|uniref:N-acetyltransferase n=1 Tax=Methanoculleus caldifontis TaxID=2651577 RepID=A0ABU3WZD8_9EURY|nr:N-acetyltransferase family protein [Methanoculleus sp. Wushi-C6]MDV2481169.1 N-acetyltransferase [Methanoculleus sp. Wushi-C6]